MVRSLRVKNANFAGILQELVQSLEQAERRGRNHAKVSGVFLEALRRVRV